MMAVQVDALDPQSFDVEVYRNGDTVSPIATLNFTNSLGEEDDGLNGAYNKGDKLSFAVVNNTATTKSLFQHISLTVELTETS
jgi:hypothetical protein